MTSCLDAVGLCLWDLVELTIKRSVIFSGGCMADECASSPTSDGIGLLRCNGNVGGMPDGGA